jgi:hypothetical protein
MAVPVDLNQTTPEIAALDIAPVQYAGEFPGKGSSVMGNG